MMGFSYKFSKNGKFKNMYSIVEERKINLEGETALL